MKRFVVIFLTLSFVCSSIVAQSVITPPKPDKPPVEHWKPTPKPKQPQKPSPKPTGQWVDLGLPSGTLWKSENETGYYSYSKALKKYGEKNPTDRQWWELMKYCTFVWDSIKKGYKVIGPNGNSIFIPALGYKNCQNKIVCVGEAGYYWLRTVDATAKEGAWHAFLFPSKSPNSRQRDIGFDGRFNCGMRPVRLVNGPPPHIYFEISRKHHLFSANGGVKKMTVSSFNYWRTDNSLLDKSWVSLEEKGDTIIIKTTQNSTDYERITSFKIETEDSVQSVIIRQRGLKSMLYGGYVDLGLPSGTLWKNTNETNPSDSYGFYTYDEAVQVFDNALPTKEQFEELYNKCTWKWTGNGYRVTGKNNNSIFMPAAGIRFCAGRVGAEDSSGGYWSSTHDGTDYAWHLFFNSGGGVGMDSDYRCYGISVRLVQKVISEKKTNKQ